MTAQEILAQLRKDLSSDRRSVRLDALRRIAEKRGGGIELKRFKMVLYGKKSSPPSLGGPAAGRPGGWSLISLPSELGLRSAQLLPNPKLFSSDKRLALALSTVIS